MIYRERDQISSKVWKKPKYNSFGNKYLVFNKDLIRHYLTFFIKCLFHRAFICIYTYVKYPINMGQKMDKNNSE